MSVPTDVSGEVCHVHVPVPASPRRQESDFRRRITSRLVRRGPATVPTSELLAVALAIRGPSDRAFAALRHALRERGVHGLHEIDVREWMRVYGMPRAPALKLVALFETGRRAYGKAMSVDRPRMIRPREVYQEVRDLAYLKKEHLVGLYLDAQNGLIHRETLSVGSLNTTRTHPREILYPAILHLALGFILAHNHPSGSLDPSDEDVAFSRAVQRAGEIVGIELYDHLIITGRGFVSLRERGAL